MCHKCYGNPFLHWEKKTIGVSLPFEIKSCEYQWCWTRWRLKRVSYTIKHQTKLESYCRSLREKIDILNTSEAGAFAFRTVALIHSKKTSCRKLIKLHEFNVKLRMLQICLPATITYLRNHERVRLLRSLKYIWRIFANRFLSKACTY